MKGVENLIAEQGRMQATFENLLDVFAPAVAAGMVTREVAVDVFAKYGLVYPDLSATIRQVAAEPSEPAAAVHTAPTKGGKAHIYLSALPVTASQKSWLHGNGFRELTITFADLQELLWKGKS